ncbi:MAG: hypothetical protein SFU53_09820 [Terrimicrobiaceae bacterium]|nr:hypothetical protein [Terrimicrobiaceae bacterium]
MNDFFAEIARNLNVPESRVRDAVRSLLVFAREKAGPDVDALIARIPGAKELMAEPAPAEGASAGGFLSGLLGAAGSLMGGQTGDLAQVAARLEAAGIPAEKILPFAQQFFTEVQKTAGPDVMAKLAANFPGIARVITKP